MTTNSSTPETQKKSLHSNATRNQTLPVTTATSLNVASAEKATSIAATKRLRPLRFALGLLITTFGMSIILLIGVRMLDVQQLGGDFTLVLVAIGVLTGVMMLGGGFGLMATAASGFDDNEFDRLIDSGNISAVSNYTDTRNETLTESAA